MRKYRFIFILLIILLSSLTASAQVRKAVVSGQFYPDDPKELRSLINKYIDAVPDNQDIGGKLVALICPHAGYIYSGQTAAYSYKLLINKKYDAVIIVGVSHFYPFKGVSVWKSGEWGTPLGLVPVAEDIARELIDYSPLIKFDRIGHIREHSVEVQIPFLQIVQPGVPIVPVVTGDRDPQSIHTLADALSSVVDHRNVLIIASSDLAHYFDRKTAFSMDKIGIDCLRDLDYNKFIKKLNGGETQFCGGSGVAAVTEASTKLGADKFVQLYHSDSGYATGDSSSVVSYLAAAFVKTDNHSKGKSKMKENKNPFSLNDEQKTLLLKIARDAIVDAVTPGKEPHLPVVKDSILDTNCGSFVTITENGQLRGCIGYIRAYKPLYQTVHECAISAALNDYRFTPLQQNELDKIHLEISVLSPLEKVENLDDIKVGRDGLLIVKGAYQGVLLPQVATEYGWDRTTFLEQTCRKAGLPPDAYKDKDTTIYKFSAEVFSE